MKVGSLFSGIGGIELGFELAGGFETAWFVEFDPYAQRVLKKNFPEVHIYGDIRTIDFQQATPIDVLAGGFPCQDISNAGKRAGIAGERSGLWKEFARAIKETKPKYVFIENVSALLNRGLNVVLQDLHSLGYDAEWHCFPASAVGAPHRRDRIMVLAYPHGRRQLHRESEEHSSQGREYAQRDLATASGKVLMEYSNDHGQSSAEERGSSPQGSDSGSSRAESSSELARSGAVNTFVADSKHDGFYGCSERGGSKTGDGESGLQELEGCDSTPSSVPNSSCEGLEGQRESERVQEKHSDNREHSWWSTEPLVCRVADGVPARVERIKCLGNAVVPFWASVAAQRIKDIEAGL